jgi:hypothetical protein
MESNDKQSGLTRAQIRKRICNTPLSPGQYRRMHQALKELRRENSLLKYLLALK